MADFRSTSPSSVLSCTNKNQLSRPLKCTALRMARPESRGRGSPRTFMPSPLPSQTSDERLPTIAWLYTHVPRLVWKAHVRSGDLFSRGAQRQHGARVRRVRGIRQLFWCDSFGIVFPIPVPAPTYRNSLRVSAAYVTGSFFSTSKGCEQRAVAVPWFRSSRWQHQLGQRYSPPYSLPRPRKSGTLHWCQARLRSSRS